MNQSRIFLAAVVCLLLFPFNGFGQYGIVTRLAGITPANMSYGFSGENVPAIDSSVLFSVPGGLCLDTAGNIFIYDGLNARIRKINHATNIITTIAGNGIAGYSGDGGPGPLAEIGANFYASICADRLGNVYVADVINNRVRKIYHATGFISTVAGNGIDSFVQDGILVTRTSLSPNAVYVDASGNIFVAGNNRIRKISATTGIINTIAKQVTTGPVNYYGNYSIADITGDAAGNIYFTDMSTYTI